MYFNKSLYVVYMKINGNKEKGLGFYIVVVVYLVICNYII